MSLVNMKVQKPVVPDGTASTLINEQPDYPYGLRIYLEEQQLGALGVGELPKIGAEFTIVARAKVCGASADPSKADGQGRRLELQITDLQLDGDKPAESEDQKAARRYTAPIQSRSE